MEKKKALTTKEIFCGMPYLKRYFQQMESTIKRFSPTEGKTENVEELKEKMRALLKAAKEMDIADLQIIYYLHRLQRINSGKMLLALKKLFQAQEELSALVKVPERH